MDGKKRTPGSNVERPVRRGRPERWRRRGERWVSLVLVLGAVAAKVDAYRNVVQHRAHVMAILGVALFVSVLRPRPVIFALLAAPLIALAVHPHPLLFGIGIGFGVFALLTALFFGIATVLHARQPRR